MRVREVLQMMVAVIVACAVGISSAHAISVPNEKIQMHFTDYTHFYDTAGDGIGAPASNAEGRSVLRGDQMNEVAGDTFWNQGENSEYLTGANYGYWVPPTGTEVQQYDGTGYNTVGQVESDGTIDSAPLDDEALFVNGSALDPAQQSGRVEVYKDSTSNWPSSIDSTSAGYGPNAWSSGGTEYDPVTTDGNLWLSGTFKPYWNKNLDPSNVLGPDGQYRYLLNGQTVPAVYKLNVVDGVPKAWINWTGGSALDKFEPNGWGPGYDAHISATLFTDEGGDWNAWSSDPVLTYGAPEPTTLGLLGLGLVGLVGYGAVRRRKN